METTITPEAATPSQEAVPSVEQAEAPAQGLAEQPQTPEQQQQAKETAQQTAQVVDSAIPEPAAENSLPIPKPDGEAPQPDPTAEAGKDQSDRVVPAADGYTLPEGVPKELGMFANANDMTQSQLDNAMQFFQGINTQQQQATVDAMVDGGKKLLDSWGDNAGYNTQLAKRALAYNDPDGKLSEMLKNSSLGHHPAVLEYLYNVGASMKEGGFIRGNINTPPGKQTLAQTMYGDKHPSNE